MTVPRLSDENLRGRTVITAGGDAIGTIAELFITTDWRVEAVQVALRKDIADRIGANRTIFHSGTIEVPVSFIQSVGDAVVLLVDVEQLREAHRVPAPVPPPPLE